MKKIMALLLVGTMVLGLLTGCGRKDKEPDKDNGKIENDDTGKEDGSEDGKDDEPAEIVELKAYFGATKPDDDTLKAVNDAVNKYLEEKIGAHLEMVFEDFGAITETMTMEMGAQSDFDICFTSSWANPFEAAASKGGYYDITELIETVTPDLYAQYGNYMWGAATIDGKLYGVPNFQVVAGKGHGILINKELADKYNFTFEDLHSQAKVEEFLKAVKENEPELYPTRIYGNVENYADKSSDSLWSLGTGLLVDQTGDVPKFVSLYETEEWVDKLIAKNEAFIEWMDKGYIRSDVASMGDDTAEVNAGKYAMLPEWFQVGEGEYVIEGTTYYAIETDAPLVEVSGVQASMLAVGAKSKNPEKALQVIELLHTDREFYQLFAYGIEGEHYEVDEAGFGAPIENNAYAGVQSGAGWAYGNGAFRLQTKEAYTAAYPDLATDKVDYEGIFAYENGINENGKLTSFYGFSFNQEPVQAEIVAVQEIVNGYGDYGFLYADNLEDYYTEIAEKVNEVGMQKIVDEYNKQLTAWWEANK